MTMPCSSQRHRLQLICLLITLVLVCSHAPLASGRDLVIGQGTDISLLDPHYSTSASDVNVFFNLYDNLVLRDESLNLTPGLATSWQMLDDKTWQFKLREGVVFHNGDRFSAEDVQFSLERAISENPRTSVFAALNTIERVDILDPATVHIVTRQADPLLPTRLSYYGGMMLPKQYFEKVGMEGFRKDPIGTGALKFVEWKKNERLVFEANKRYWRAPLPYTKVTFRPYPETAARMAALIAGEVDLITAVPPDQVDVLEKSGTAKVEGAPYAGFFAYYMNVKNPPLDNKLVRQALHYAVDRQAIVKKLWRGRGVVPNDAYPSVDKIGYDKDKRPFEFDPKKAKELLAKAGYKGEEIVIESAVGYLANDKQLTEALGAMFQEVGIKAKVQLIEYSVRAQKLRQKAIDGLLLGDPTSTLLDPDGMFWRLMQPGGLIDYWRDAEWDRLMGEARFLQDAQKRDALYKQAAKIFLDEVPVLIVLQPEKTFALKKDLHWKARSDEIVVVYDIKPVKPAP
jgi:peptide/nickel transport system substrate-binding protein